MSKVKVTIERDGKIVNQTECQAVVGYHYKPDHEGVESDGSSFIVGLGSVEALICEAASALGLAITTFPDEIDRDALVKKAALKLMLGYLKVSQDILYSEDSTDWGALHAKE